MVVTVEEGVSDAIEMPSVNMTAAQACGQLPEDGPVSGFHSQESCLEDNRILKLVNAVQITKMKIAYILAHPPICPSIMSHS